MSGTQLLLRRLPAGLGLLAYAPRGPVVAWADATRAASALEAAAQAARQVGALALVVEPDLEDAHAARRLLGASGFTPLDFSVQPRRTIVVDISASDEATVLGAMKQKTRYNIGLAARKGVTVRAAGESDLAAFGALMAETAGRDGFSIHPAGYYADAWRRLGADATLMLAEADGQLLAGLFAVACGTTATYLYGASTSARRELMAPYRLQWEAMRWARARGCARYDLWGVPDADEAALEAGFETRHDGLWGVYRHKRGYGGRLIRFVEAWVRPLSPLRWALYQAARKVRKTHGLAA